MSRADRIEPFTRRYAGRIRYDASSGDNDHDGLPNRADLTTGGADCTGWGHNVDVECWRPDPPRFPLTNTSGYALIAKARKWIRVHRPGIPQQTGGLRPGDIMPGDFLIRSRHGDVYNSGGPDGHFGAAIRVLPSGLVLTSESYSGTGVGLVERPAAFWLMSIAIPGMLDGTVPRPLTPAELETFIRILRELDVEHGAAVDFVIDGYGRTLTLDRQGGMHLTQPSGRVYVEWEGGLWKPGEDVARRIVLTRDTVPLAGFVMDQDGNQWAFSEAGGPVPRVAASPRLPADRIAPFRPGP